MTQKFDLGRAQESKAMNKYHQFYNNHVYATAVKGKSNKYANELIDNALALCGHPHYQMTNRHWSDKAIDFLKLYG